MNHRIILASKSPRRIELLEKAGLDVIVMPANIEEYIDPRLAPDAVVKSLALQKATAVKEALREVHSLQSGYDNADNPTNIISISNVSDSITFSINTPIIAADTIVYLDEIIGKPTDRADAEKILMHLSGKEHQVYTGVAILSLCDDDEIVFSDKTSVFFKPYSLNDLHDYLDTPEPYDKAGAYAIQGYFGQFIDHIDGDYSNVMGLPVNALLDKLNTTD